MAGNLLQQLYNTADTIIVGNFNGQQALSAVGACASLTVLFTALAIGFSIGAGVLISQYFGASRERELRQYAATAIVLMLAMGLFMSLAGVVSARFLLERVLGTPEALLPMTLLYFRIYAAGLVFQFGYNIAAALLRALGDSKATLYFLLVSSILNVVLDLAFVAGRGLGVAGAAVATVISQIASCVIGFAYMHRKYALLRFSLRELRLDVKTAGRILQVGAPMAENSTPAFIRPNRNSTHSTGSFRACSISFSRSWRCSSAAEKMPNPRSAWGIAGITGSSPSAGCSPERAKPYQLMTPAIT